MGLPRRSRQRQRRRCPLRTSGVSITYPLLFLPAALTAAASSQVRQNYHPDCEAAINRHIQFQLYVSYVYLSMAAFCDHRGLNEKPFTRFFLSKSHEWSAFTEMFLTLQNERGGRIVFRNIEKPNHKYWINGLASMECAFHLEMTVNESFLDLYRLASSKNDAHLCSFLKHRCLQPHFQVIREMFALLSNLRQVEAKKDDIIEYLFTKLYLDDRSSKN
ncbi:hypothetical protein A6R68_01624 [Neotoma lepida]|uniref:Ferritin n=1 Tax=Neotoma lepida TaxID=56216 RepID=A0A1A6GUJ1_NEOLE|nr:hypothetical protein A6R68_01624 [Neotoma lepida]